MEKRFKISVYEEGYPPIFHSAHATKSSGYRGSSSTIWKSVVFLHEILKRLMFISSRLVS
ncbi:hypothetical protein Lser_V15G39459 [Lactuca serriola]